MTILRWALLAALVVAAASALWSLLPSEATAPSQIPSLQIEVLNGSSESLLAQRVAQELQAAGHEVVRIDNAEHHEFATTFGIDRRGKLTWTRALLEQIGPCRLIQERQPGARADLTLVLGADWAQMSVLGGAKSPPLRR